MTVRQNHESPAASSRVASKVSTGSGIKYLNRADLQLQPVCRQSLPRHAGYENRLLGIPHAGSIRKKPYFIRVEKKLSIESFSSFGFALFMATVTISEPLDWTVLRRASPEENLPVPIKSLERNDSPPRARKSSLSFMRKPPQVRTNEPALRRLQG